MGSAICYLVDAVEGNRVERAKERNCKLRKFSEYRGEIKMELNTKGYLEASKNKVKGYIVNLKLQN